MLLLALLIAIAPPAKAVAPAHADAAPTTSSFADLYTVPAPARLVIEAVKDVGCVATLTMSADPKVKGVPVLLTWEEKVLVECPSVVALVAPRRAFVLDDHFRPSVFPRTLTVFSPPAPPAEKPAEPSMQKNASAPAVTPAPVMPPPTTSNDGAKP